MVGAALQSTPRKRRFVVLTNMALKWYKKKESDELFGDLVGGVFLKGILRIALVDEYTFELTSAGTHKSKSCSAPMDGVARTHHRAHRLNDRTHTRTYVYYYMHADRRRRVFVAGGQDERDLWVEYISEGMKKQHALKLQRGVPAADSAPSSAGSDSSSLDMASPYVKVLNAPHTHCRGTLPRLSPFPDSIDETPATAPAWS